MGTHREQLETFTLDSLPDLDVVTLGALERFIEDGIPTVNRDMFRKPLVIGSVNAAETGKIMFAHHAAVFANQDSYVRIWENNPDVDGVIIVSASGSKHAIEIAQAAAQWEVPTILMTNNPDAPARAYIPDEQVYVFPRNREPYTYNTSTYLGMLFGSLGTDPKSVYEHITKTVAPTIPNSLGSFSAFCCIVPPEFGEVRGMLRTKFEELFGPKVVGRIFTYEEVKHAKTVVPDPKECFLSFGVANTTFGTPEQRVHIPLPDPYDPIQLMAIGYYVIGRIQKQHPPYFKENIVSYTKQISKIFNTDINPIVE